MRKLTLIILLAISLSFTTILVGCRHKTEAWDTMDKAEELMISHPDSAFELLLSLDKDRLGDSEEKARYALLMSMALDKNYIDTTTFDVLQPAIDYYLSSGNSDEKLRTLYYQGRIYQNCMDYDNAMRAFLKAEDLDNRYTDTLTYANLLTAQGTLYFKSYQLDRYIDCNLKAADLYDRIQRDDYRFVCLAKSLDGSIAIGQKNKADSIMLAIDSVANDILNARSVVSIMKLKYGIFLDSVPFVREALSSLDDIDLYNDDAKLNIALGSLMVNEDALAKDAFDRINVNSPICKSTKYLSIKSRVLEQVGAFKEALDVHKEYLEANDAENARIYSEKTTVAEQQYRADLENQHEIRKKDKLIWLGLCVSLALIIVICIIYYQLRLSRAKHAIMSLEISRLESESEKMKALLKDSELPKLVRDAIKERIEILNSLLAAEITDNDNYSKPYKKWISKVIEDKDKFMSSTRLAFQASHPAFIKFLEDKGLSESEMNYVCMYAIGLRGKEIGEYIQLKRHYHISSDIRKKFGLTEEDTNLGLYVKALLKEL